MTRVLFSAMLAMSVGVAGTVGLGDEPPLGRADFVPAPERPVGWRGDGSGVFAGAKGVATTWNEETGDNVLWKAEVGYLSIASPIVVGDRVFTTAEPFDLVCLQAATGKILWRRSEHPELERVSAEEGQALAEKYRHLLAVAERYVYETGGASELWSVARNWASYADPEVLENVHYTAKPAIAWLNSPATRDFLAGLKLQAGDLAGLLEELRGSPPREGEAPKHPGYGFPEPPVWVGSAAPTPASDGKHVYVKYLNGILACYDLEGNRRWAVRYIDGPEPREYCGVSSPLLVMDKVVTYHRDHMKAFAKEDGKLLWSAGAKGCRWNCTAPALARVGGRDILIAHKDAIRADDGRVLATEVTDPTGGRGTSPSACGDLLFCEQFDKWGGYPVLTRLVPRTADEYESQIVWHGAVAADAPADLPRTAILSGAGKLRTTGWASPLFHNGMIYSWGGGWGAPRVGVLAVMDAKTGRLVRQDTLCHFGTPPKQASMDPSKVLGGLSNRFPCINPTVADGFLFVGYSAVPRSLIIALRLRPDGDVEEAGRSTVDTMLSSPFFHGSRMYLRTYRYLYCIGPTTGQPK